MKKTITTIMIFLVALTCLNAATDIYTTLNLEYSHDTNVFSSPLPLYDDTPGYQWLNWKQTHPFLQKHSLGFNLSGDIFFSPEARVGLSTGISVKFPLAATNFTPTPEDPTAGFTGKWDYVETNAIDNQHIAVFGSFGPIFRAQFGFADLGVAVRLSLGGYDYIDSEVILGLQAEPYFNIFVGDTFYISIKFTYDSHMIRFIADEVKVFEENYQMLSLAPSIGIGLKF